jgi:hypothetical protein
LKQSAASNVGSAVTENPTNQELDAKIARLRSNRQRWLKVPIRRKIEYLQSIIDGTARVASRQVAAEVRAKGLDLSSPAAGEAWLGGPFTQARVVRLMMESLQQIDRTGRIAIPFHCRRQLESGHLSVRVFPLRPLDRLLFQGFTAEVWMQPEVTAENLDEHTGVIYRNPPAEGKVALVLGAGNVASIASLDAVHKLFSEGQVTLLKFNPVNEYLAPFVAEAFGALIADGFMATTTGSAPVGEYLCNHPEIDEIHITGSEETHNAIVFGPGGEGEKRRALNQPRLQKRITSELGNVSPIIIVPGRWSRADLKYHAANLATQITQNGGFNCNAAKVILLHDDWPQQIDFLSELRNVLASLPPRPAYYPGAESRYERFIERYPDTEVIGPKAEGCIPPSLITGLQTMPADQLAFTTESFCSISGVLALSGRDPTDFLGRAVRFCNNTLNGTLNAGIIIDPQSKRRMRSALDRAIQDLRYGTVAMNHWPAVGYALGTSPWGASPGHTLEAVESGIGFVHNTLLLDRSLKTVIDAPFRTKLPPTPPWFVTHRQAHRATQSMADLEISPSLPKLIKLLFYSFRA